MKIKNLLPLILAGLIPIPAYNQIKISKVEELSEASKSASDALQDIALYVNAGGLAIAIFFCVYFVATNHPKAKEYVISIIVALAIYLVAVNLIF